MKKSSVRAKKKIRNAHKELMKLFMKSPVTNIRFSGGKISLTYFGHRISDKFIVKRVTHVGEWSRRRKEVTVDKNFNSKERKKELKSLAVHEAVERFLVKTYGLNTDNEAHLVALQKEKEFLKKEKGNWRGHQMRVFWDWYKLGEK
ncbi:MAG: hypothetical protein AABW47_04370 [Nanoarchaeota archaeon]